MSWKLTEAHWWRSWGRACRSHQGPCRRKLDGIIQGMKDTSRVMALSLYLPNCDRKGFFKRKQVSPTDFHGHNSHFASLHQVLGEVPVWGSLALDYMLILKSFISKRVHPERSSVARQASPHHSTVSECLQWQLHPSKVTILVPALLRGQSIDLLTDFMIKG